MMTKAQMEEAIRNLDRRLVNVEQILPTLATRQDVREALREAVAESNRHADVRFESLRDDIRMVAEAVAAIPARFDEMNARFDRLSRDADTRFARTDARLDRMDERFDRLEERFERLEDLAQSTATGLETLTGELKDKGAI